MHPALHPYIGCLVSFEHCLLSVPSAFQPQVHGIASRHTSKIGSIISLNSMCCCGAVSSALQAALQEQLARDAGAMPAFITGLRHYLHQPLRLKRLLQPCVEQDPPEAAAEAGARSTNGAQGVKWPLESAAAAELPEDDRRASDERAAGGFATTDATTGVSESEHNGAVTCSAEQAMSQTPATHAQPASVAPSGLADASGEGSPCLLSLLTSIAPLRPALVDLLMDTMVAACQHARGADRAAAGAGEPASAAHPSAVATRELSSLPMRRQAVSELCSNGTLQSLVRGFTHACHVP